MFSTEKCRQIDSSLKNFSDEEIIGIMENLYGIARLALEDYTRKKSDSKNPEWLLSNNKGNNKI